MIAFKTSEINALKADLTNKALNGQITQRDVQKLSMNVLSKIKELEAFKSNTSTMAELDAF